MQEQEYRKRNKRVRYESKSKSEQENEDFEQNYRGDYLDSNDSNEQKYSSGERQAEWKPLKIQLRNTKRKK